MPGTFKRVARELSDETAHFRNDSVVNTGPRIEDSGNDTRAAGEFDSREARIEDGNCVDVVQNVRCSCRAAKNDRNALAAGRVANVPLRVSDQVVELPRNGHVEGAPLAGAVGTARKVGRTCQLVVVGSRDCDG